jgi:hypothetical protein
MQEKKPGAVKRPEGIEGGVATQPRHWAGQDIAIPASHLKYNTLYQGMQ